MNKKILSIIVCLAMLISALAVSTYAATIDIEIDLGGGFFGDDDETTVGTGGEGDGKGENSTPDDELPDEKPDDKDETPKDDSPSKDNGSGSSQSRYEDLVPDKKEEESEQPKEWVNNFTDVKESDWFYPTVKYVSENGIVNGYEDGTFLPNNNITREQIATIVYRYAKTKGYDVTLGGMAVREYEDYEAISSWAREAMQWAVNTKLITGKTATTVNPLDNATRAEAATIIMRFIEANK